MNQFLAYLCKGIPLDPLPKNRKRKLCLAHAPKRLHQLNQEQKNLAIRNALRYFPKHLHSLLKEEFRQELEEYGHIYMYRFKADLPSSNELHWQAFPARNIHCAAIMLQICNNLSVEIAQYPEELVTYGGNGQCLANWAQFWILMQMLSELDLGETLVLSSSHPQGVYQSEPLSKLSLPVNSLTHWSDLMNGFAQQNLQPLRSPTRPLMQISNGLCVPNYSTSAHYADFFALGVSNYGQMTAGSFCYIGPQGIVHGTTITLMSAAEQYRRSLEFDSISDLVSTAEIVKHKDTAQYVQEIQFPFTQRHYIQYDRKGTVQSNINQKKSLAYLSSGLGGMSGAQAKAGLIANVVAIIAEVRPEPIVKRFNQKWVDEVITDLDLLIDRLRQLRNSGQISSIAYFGNVVNIWERLVQIHSENGEVLVDLASDQTSCHDIRNGGYIPVGVTIDQLNELIFNQQQEFQGLIQSSLRRQVQAINYLSDNTKLLFWDYGNAFLLESMKAGADLMLGNTEPLDPKEINQFNIVNMKLRYRSYIESIMGDIFSLGFGPFRWICSSNKEEDLELTDKIAIQVLQSELSTLNNQVDKQKEKLRPEQLHLIMNRRLQLINNLNWIKEAKHHQLVVGCKSRILYTDRRGRERIAIEFNKSIRNHELNGPIVISRDHHDVSSVDSPFRETSNITDGSKFTADMAVHNAIGLSSRGVTWVAIHNGGGVGFGESINGGFGLVLDGTQISEQTIELVMNWDVNNGVSRRAWDGNANAIGTIEQEMIDNKVKVTRANFADT